MKRALIETENIVETVVPETDSVEPQEPPTKKKQKPKHNDTSHEFSTKEISRLQESEAVFHSSLFRLQITELLKEVSLKQKLRQRIQGAIDTLKKLVEGFPSGKEHKIVDRKWLEASGVQVPVVESPSNVKGMFQFLPPVEVKVTGSFAHNTVVKPCVEATLVMYIPKSCFQPKDYLNHRCVRKQALYLAHVATKLSKKKQVEQLQYSYYLGNPLKPMLVVTIKGKDNKNVKVQLLAVPEPDTFKLSRFEVTKNNVRPKWFSGKTEEDDTDASSLPATPFYNMSLAHDLCVSANEELMERTVGSEGVRQGVMLLKVWLRQRQLDQGWGSFSGELLTCYVAHLIMKKKLNKMMNSYQVFRQTLLSLSKSSWSEEPPTLKEDLDSSKLEEFVAKFPCVFVDSTGTVNLAYMLTQSMISRVKEESRLSISALEQSHQRSFDVLFMTPMSPPRAFDYVFHLSLSSSVFQSAQEKLSALGEGIMDHGGHMCLALMGHVEELLTKALDTRVTLVQATPLLAQTWPVTDAPYSYDSERVMTFGLRLNPTGALSVLNKGPAADSPHAKEFREFWGEKCEMRRFKDGTIHEAVLWTSSPLQADRRMVVKRIVHNIMHRHCGIEKSSVQFVGHELDSLLHATGIVKGEGRGTGEEHSLDVIHAFDDINKAVRSLASLPLGIHAVQGTHPVFRHCDVFPPTPTCPPPDAELVYNMTVPEEGKALPPYVPALTVVCMLEGSGKWPEDKEAIACLKALLHVKMAAELREKHLLPVAVARGHVDVFKSGFVFRLVLANAREIAVLRTVKTDSGMVKFKDTEEAVSLERDTVMLPHHTHLLHSIQQEHPSFSSSVRLCKRWLSCQMLWGAVTEPALELMLAHVFMQPHPYTAPGSPLTGLLRFLHLLSSFNWAADPLMINLNHDFTQEDFSAIPKDMTRHRSTLPPMVIATPQDKMGARWTRATPTEPILQRLVVLARESLRVLEGQVMAGGRQDYKAVFRPQLSSFDISIQLLKKVNVLRHHAVDSRTDGPTPSDPVTSGDGDVLPAVEVNLCVNFYEDLKASYGEYALFFYDPFGGDTIGMVWKRQAMEAKPFKPSNLNGRKPTVDENEQVNLDVTKEAILDDIRILGGGIVESIKSSQKES